MSVKVENTENKNEVKLEITVDAKVFDEGIVKVYNKNAKYFNIPGFRKGKAPMNIVERYYGASIQNQKEKLKKCPIFLWKMVVIYYL